MREKYKMPKNLKVRTWNIFGNWSQRPHHTPPCRWLVTVQQTEICTSTFDTREVCCGTGRQWTRKQDTAKHQSLMWFTELWLLEHMLLDIYNFTVSRSVDNSSTCKHCLKMSTVGSRLEACTKQSHQRCNMNVYYCQNTAELTNLCMFVLWTEWELLETAQNPQGE